MRRDSIYHRIDAALEKARWRKLEVRGLHLSPMDYFALAEAETQAWQKETGSTALVWPLSYDSTLIFGDGKVAVREATRSRLLTKGGEEIIITRSLSAKVAA